MTENGNKLEMRKYLRIQRLDTQKCNSSYIKNWNLTTIKIFEFAKEDIINNIRMYFQMVNR